MDPLSIRRTFSLPFLLLGLALLTPRGTAQSTCYHFGSRPMAATIEASPVLLGCAAAPTWPQWHLFTPAHREPCAHFGFNPGSASQRKRVLVAYQCTGFLLVPVVPVHVRVMGYVIDQPEFACGTIRP